MSNSTSYPGRRADVAPADARAPAWVINRPPAPFAPFDVRELWRYSDLAVELGLRDLRLRYKQTGFGVAWAIVQPLAASAVFAVFLGHLVGVPTDGLPYLVFAYVGFMAWTFFSTVTSAGAESLVEHRVLVTQVYFPRLLAPLATVLAALVDLAVMLGIFAVILLFSAHAPGIALATAPAWIGALALVSLAFGVWAAALNALYRDVRYVLGFALQLLLFLSPVLYASSVVQGPAAYAYALNPLVGVLDGLRWSLAGGPPPGAETCVSLVSAIMLLIGSVVYFQRVERRLADRI